jgi:hypothetical protein
MFFTDKQRSRLDFLEKLVVELADKVQKTSNAQLLAQIDELRGAMDLQRSSTRKELSSMWGRLGGRPQARDVIDTYQAPSGDFEAMLDLQLRPPVKPNGG